MAVQVSVRSAGEVTFVGTTSRVKVGATAEMEGGKNDEVQTRSSLQGTVLTQNCVHHFLLKSISNSQLLTSNKQSEVLYILRLFHTATAPHSVNGHTLVKHSIYVPCVTVCHVGERQHPRGPVHRSHVVHLGGLLGVKDHTAVRGGAELCPIPSPGDGWGRDTKCTAGQGHILAFVHHIQVLEGRDINLSSNWGQGKTESRQQLVKDIGASSVDWPCV